MGAQSSKGGGSKGSSPKGTDHMAGQRAGTGLSVAQKAMSPSNPSGNLPSAFKGGSGKGSSSKK